MESNREMEYESSPDLLKRIFDVVFSSCVLFALSPLFLLLFLSIKLTSKGPAFFAQIRVGLGGKLFRCYKFRTMHIDAEERLIHLLEAHPELKKEWDEKHKLTNDPRITWLGKWLRKYSFDELPQFWNVLSGEMSIVGPRPRSEKEVYEKLGIKAMKVLSVKPGITGLWQISGRSNTSYEMRNYLDENYVDSRTFLKDLFIILKTVPAFWNSSGAC